MTEAEIRRMVADIVNGTVKVVDNRARLILNQIVRMLSFAVFLSSIVALVVRWWMADTFTGIVAGLSITAVFFLIGSASD